MQQPPEQPQQYPYPQPPYGAPPPPSGQPKKKIPVWLWVVGIILILGICGGISEAMGLGGATGTANQQPASATNAPASTPAATPSPTPTPKPLVWTTTHTYTGNGNKKTATFAAPGDWKIIWKCDPTANAIGQYNIIIDVKNADGSDLDPGAINTICRSGNTTGETEERQGGQVYLDVQSEDNWQIQIQEQK